MGGMNAVIFGDMVYLNAKDLHSNIPNETEFHIWIEWIRKNFNPIPGAELVEIGGARDIYLCQFIAGLIIQFCSDNKEVILSIRHKVNKSVSQLYSVLNNGGKEEEKNPSHDENMRAIYEYIEANGAMSKTEISRKFTRLGRGPRDAAIEGLVGAGLIDRRMARLDGSRRSTYVFSLMED
jgi:hypothetical protein